MQLLLCLTSRRVDNAASFPFPLFLLCRPSSSSSSSSLVPVFLAIQVHVETRHTHTHTDIHTYTVHLCACWTCGLHIPCKCRAAKKEAKLLKGNPFEYLICNRFEDRFS